MKYMIASDIHGSFIYCTEMCRQYEKEGADRLILLGDLLYHGPRNDLPDGYEPKKVISLLNELKREIFAVRGNCDTEVDQMVLEFPILADYAVFDIKGRAMYVSHGHVYNETKLPPLKNGDILLNGHTHTPKVTEHEEYIYLNPGSVSIPKENSKRGYMIYEDGEFVWKSLDGITIMNYSLI